MAKKMTKDYLYKVDVQMTPKTYKDYLQYRTKSNAGMIFPYIIGVALVWQAIKGFGTDPLHYTVIYLAFAFMFTFGVWINVHFRSIREMRSEEMQQVMPYYFSEEGIIYAYDPDNVVPWDAIWRIDTSKLNIIIFVTNKLAFFLPKECVEDYEGLRELMLSKVDPKRIRMD